MPTQAIRVSRQQIGVLSNTTRLEVHALLRTDGPATAKQLAEKMGKDEMSLYYHLRLLASNGLIDAETRPGTTKPETVYSVKGKFIVDDLNIENKSNLEEQKRNVDTLLRAISKEHVEAATTFGNRFHDESSISRMAVRLTKSKAKELRRRLRELNQWIDANSSPSGDRYSVSTFLMPLTQYKQKRRSN